MPEPAHILHLTPQAPQTIDAGKYFVVNVTGGWVEGPKSRRSSLRRLVTGVQVLASGVARLDVRGTMVTDDDQLIFISYSGVVDTQVNGTHDASSVATDLHARYGRPVDVLVSNAGIEDNRSGNLLTMSDSMLRKIVEVNLFGAINTARAFAPTMPDGSKIVFVSSLQALMVSLPGTSYQASKAGLIGVAKALAVELGPRRINVNVICPGGVATEGMGAARSGEGGLDDFRRLTPLGRRARSEEIAYPILFLCSEWASYMTGQIVQVDGGKSAMGMSRPGPVSVSPDDPDK